MTKQFFKSGIEAAHALKAKVLQSEDFMGQAAIIAELCLSTFQSGNKILFAGNGGSAVDAQHLVGELVCRFYYNRPALAAIALTADNAVITAAGNDFGYDSIFARQVEALGQKGDLLIGLSTSGNSENVIKAFAAAKDKGLKTVAFTGETGGKMLGKSDHILQVPSCDTPRIQEIHMLVGHLLCEWLEKEIFPKEDPKG